MGEKHLNAQQLQLFEELDPNLCDITASPRDCHNRNLCNRNKGIFFLTLKVLQSQQAHAVVLQFALQFSVINTA